MMDKKGAAIHVDWAIGMGVFLIAIITFIILLQPGVQPLTDTDTLMNIIEEHFNNETLWTIKRVPLHILALDSEDPDMEEPPEIVVTVRGEERKTGQTFIKPQWSFSKFEIPEYGEDKDRFKFNPPDGNVFEATCSIGVCETEDAYGKSEYPFYLIAYQLQINPIEPIFKWGCNTQDKDRCNAYIGSSEDIKGYNANWILSIANDQQKGAEAYDALKERWGYPAGSDFAIFVQGGETVKFDGDIIASPEMPQQANVKAKLIKSWLIDAEGDKEQVTISIRVW